MSDKKKWLSRNRVIACVLVIGTLVVLSLLTRRAKQPQPVAVSFEVIRLPDNPIIRAGMDARMAEEAEQYGYVNINGPSLIRAPRWLEGPLGKYYLYFAHHNGEYIRLAYADDLRGPWKTYEPGCLQLEESFFTTSLAQNVGALSALARIWRQNPPSIALVMTRVGIDALRAESKRKAEGIRGATKARPHIASPDVHVDDERREIRMYFHGRLEDRTQMSRVAVSSDGINFEVKPEAVAHAYLRMFRYRDRYYGMAMPGLLYRSEDGLTGFELRRKPAFEATMRHTALLMRGSTLYVFWSRVGDAPERILCSTIDLSPDDWNEWKASQPVEVLGPETPWEGSDLPVKASIRGEYPQPVNELRDPAIFEEDGKTYLLYSCAGEQAIAIAELKLEDESSAELVLDQSIHLDSGR